MSFIKLHRKISEWEWYTDSNTFRLFVHLLINASYDVNQWQGISIQPGQLLTGRIKLARELKLTEQEIRTSISKLKSTSEITIKSTNKFSIITICKWGDYQPNVKVDQPANQPAGQPTINQQSTTTIEREEGKEEKKVIYRQFVHLKITVSDFNKLIETGYSKKQIDDKLDDIENWKGNNKYKSLFKTANNWLKRDYPEVTAKLQNAASTSTSEFDYDSLTSQHLASMQKTNSNLNK